MGMTKAQAIKDLEAASRNLAIALEQQTLCVLNARKAGLSWAAIAEPLDVSPQAAWAYYAKEA